MPSVIVIGPLRVGAEREAGDPEDVVSSWMPPESVTTRAAPPRATGSRCSRAARRAVAPAIAASPAASRRARVRGWSGEDDRQPLGEVPQRGDRASRQRRRVHERRAVKRGEQVGPRSSPSAAVSAPRRSDRRWARSVSIIVLPTRSAPGPPRSLRREVLVGHSECVRSSVDSWSVMRRLMLLGHRAVEAPQARPRRARRGMPAWRRERCGQRRVDVAGDDDDRRRGSRENSLEPDEERGRLLGVDSRSRPRARRRDAGSASSLEEDVLQRGVVVLAGVDEPLLARAAPASAARTGAAFM